MPNRVAVAERRAHALLMRRRFIPSLLFASLALSAGTALADPTTFAPWVGTYTLASPDKAEAIIERAIESGTDSMGPLRRSVARSRLKSTNAGYKTVRITPTGNEIVTDLGGRKYKAPTDGSAKKGVDPDGKPVTVSYKAAGDTMKSRYVAEDGEKRIDFEKTPDGQGMIMHVTVLSKKLPGPIKYSVRYNKK